LQPDSLPSRLTAMLVDLMISRARQGERIDLARYASFSCFMGRLRRRLGAWF